MHRLASWNRGMAGFAGLLARTPEATQLSFAFHPLRSAAALGRNASVKLRPFALAEHRSCLAPRTEDLPATLRTDSEYLDSLWKRHWLRSPSGEARFRLRRG